MKKKIVSILCVTAMIVSTVCISAYAYDKYVEKANFNIRLNNNPANLKAEMVTIDGSTYLPLRALCQDLLGMTVDWDDATKTIDLWTISKPSDRGSHETPVSKGVGVIGDFKAGKDGFVTYEMSVQSVQRGSSVESELRSTYESLHPYVPIKNNVKDRDDYKDSKTYKAAVAAYNDKEAENAQKYADKENEYIGKLLHLDVPEGLSKGTSITGRGDYELMKVKVRMDIKPSGLDFSYSTKVNDFTPYCGTVSVDGLQRQYVEYAKISPEVDSEHAYANKTILTDGISEGYMYFAVYKLDSTPRVMYKDGQYLALY